MAKKKKIGSAWSRRNRTIKGKPRRMWVRKIDGKYQTRMKTPEVHGIALASKLMAQRPKKSQKIDKQRAHKKKIRPTDKNLKAWKKRPGSADVIGDIDSKKGQKRKTAGSISKASSFKKWSKDVGQLKSTEIPSKKKNKN